MRDIKFRAWGGVDVCMHYLVPRKGAGSMGVLSDLVEEDDWKVMQYTGLKDKNGKEIYEGDVCKYHDALADNYLIEGKNAEKVIGRVTWSEDRCRFQAQEIKENHKGGYYIIKLESVLDFEVIGNIYENPELLEATTKDSPP